MPEGRKFAAGGGVLLYLQAPPKPGDTMGSLYSLKTRTLEGKAANLADYDGKVALVVNVASA